MLMSLAILSIKRATRAYGLPTLCASVLAGLWFARESDSAFLFGMWFLVCSLGAGVAFGAHACFIRWLASR